LSTRKLSAKTAGLGLKWCIRSCILDLFTQRAPNGGSEMKITQDTTTFQPVTFTVESREEAMIFWGMAEAAARHSSEMDVRTLSIMISNWFSDTAQV